MHGILDHKIYLIMIQNFYQNLNNMHQRQQTSLKQQQSTSFRWKLTHKIFITLLRTIIFISNLLVKSPTAPSPYIISSIVLLFGVAEGMYWYRISKIELKQWNKEMTAALHIFIFFNLLLIGVTLRYDSIIPVNHYFIMEVSLNFNFYITFYGVYQIYLANPAKTIDKFIELYEPLKYSVEIIFIGLYIGSLLDFVTFDESSQLLFYSLNVILILYVVIYTFSSEKVMIFKKSLTE